MAKPRDDVRIPDTKVALSTASVYPESTATAFEIAARLGYDGVEVMVWTDPVSQDIEALRRLSDYHRMPILAVHAPCLLITQRVWSTDPWVKLQRARAAAEKLGASTVVVHPPFRWQRQYARDFVDGIWRMADETDVRFAVENMYPWRYRDREMQAYAPDWDVTKDDYRHFTIDLSHAATSRTDALDMLDRMSDRLGHVHLADGRGSAKDEHLVPAAGNQPCAEVWSTSRTPASTATSSSRSTPGARCPAPNARPISPRRWPSPVCTWRSRRPRYRGSGDEDGPPVSDDAAGATRRRGHPAPYGVPPTPATASSPRPASEFSERGYDKTSVRGIAKAAGVDPALVHHYFGTKEQVFEAAIEVAFAPALKAPEAIGDGPLDEVGERLTRFILGLSENPASQPAAGHRCGYRREPTRPPPSVSPATSRPAHRGEGPDRRRELTVDRAGGGTARVGCNGAVSAT
ncbi:hypothetical protein STENM327S_04551 [Streptomyces tendae]